MQILDAIKQELDRHLAGKVWPEAYQAYLDALFSCVRGDRLLPPSLDRS